MRLFALVATLISFFSCFSKELEIEIQASSAILMNADTGQILFSKKADLLCYPASTTKIATALYVLDKGVHLEKEMVVSKEALRPRPDKDWDILPPYWLDSDGLVMDLKVGEILSVNTLLHGLFLNSANDAANVIAENLGETIPGFMELLNEYLKEIGCKGTQFKNPHGLTHPEHWTTAYDLALMTKAALKLEGFRKLLSAKKYIRPKTNKQSERELVQSNLMLNPKSRYYYPKLIGGKTGYTAAALYNFVSVAEHEGRTLIAVILGAPDKQARFEETKKIFEKAFQEKKQKRRLIGPETTFEKELLGSRRPVKTSLIKPLVVEYFPSEEPFCKAVLHWSVEALPVKKGQVVGEVQVFSEDGRFLEKGELISREDVKGALLFTIQQKILRFFQN